MIHVEKARRWIGESVSRRLAIPGLILILLLLVQAAFSGASAIRLVGRLEDSSARSNASLALTERLLTAARELSEHARAVADAQRALADQRDPVGAGQAEAARGE